MSIATRPVEVAVAGGGVAPRLARIDVVIEGEGGKVVGELRGRPSASQSTAARQRELWSPDNPFLYDLEVTLRDGDSARPREELLRHAQDRAESRRARASAPVPQRQAVFQYGPLDQGWWPDGLYTAPTDEALKYDIEMTKKLGFNMIRKHVKVEPARWYYWCDKLGMLVWQDMPSPFPKSGNDRKNRITAESAKHFETELKAMIDALRIIRRS